MGKFIEWINLKVILSIIILIVVVAAIIYVVHVLDQINHTKIDDPKGLTQFVKASSSIEVISGFDYFVDEDSYDIVYGVDADEKDIIAINPSGNKNKENLVLLHENEMYPKEQIEKNWQSSCNTCTLKKSSPAMFEDEPLWELTYLDEDNKYVLEYVSLEDGSTQERFKLKKYQ